MHRWHPTWMGVNDFLSVRLSIHMVVRIHSFPEHPSLLSFFGFVGDCAGAG